MMEWRKIAFADCHMKKQQVASMQMAGQGETGSRGSGFPAGAEQEQTARQLLRCKQSRGTRTGQRAGEGEAGAGRRGTGRGGSQLEAGGGISYSPQGQPLRRVVCPLQVSLLHGKEKHVLANRHKQAFMSMSRRFTHPQVSISAGAPAGRQRPCDCQQPQQRAP